MKNITLHANWLIKAPPPEVFNVMNDFEKWPEYFPKVAESTTPRQADGVVDFS